MKNTKYKIQNMGFTLIETIIAIAIIGVVITASAQLTQSSLQIGKSTMQKFMALQLAEEGLEIVRNLRDSNWLQNAAWRRDLKNGAYAIADNPNQQGYPWILQKITIEASAPEIELNADSRFKRIIKIEPTSEGGQENAMLITSKVTYSHKGTEKEIALSAELTNWKKGPL